MKRDNSGEYVSAHVSQANQVYQQLQKSGGVEGYRQVGDVVTFRTAQPAPLPKRRRLFRWWMWIVLAVAAFFVVAAALNAGILAVSIGASLAGIILFAVLGLIVWKASDNRGFIGTMIGGLVAGVMLIGAFTTGVEPLYNQDAANRQASIAAECGGIGGGDVQCRWDSLVESTHKLDEVAQSPASEGLGMTLLIVVGLMFGGGYMYWRSQGLK